MACANQAADQTAFLKALRSFSRHLRRWSSSNSGAATTVAARGQEFDSTLLIGIAIGSALTLFTVFIILSFHIDRLYLPPKQPTNDRLYRPPTAVAACSDETQHADGGDDAARRRAWLLAIARGARRRRA